MCVFFFATLFFFNDTATTEIYTLSLHDALPIWRPSDTPIGRDETLEVPVHEEQVTVEKRPVVYEELSVGKRQVDRKSTRLNSSHANISYAVFCLKKKIKTILFNLDRRTGIWLIL